MSWNPDLDRSIPLGSAVDAIETVIIPRARDLGGFEVRRALPSTQRQMVGPFIFFDQMGPAEFLTGQGIDVRPHPHIGLATVTYLLKGHIHHRQPQAFLSGPIACPVRRSAGTDNQPGSWIRQPFQGQLAIVRAFCRSGGLTAFHLGQAYISR